MTATCGSIMHELPKHRVNRACAITIGSSPARPQSLCTPDAVADDTWHRLGKRRRTCHHFSFLILVLLFSQGNHDTFCYVTALCSAPRADRKSPLLTWLAQVSVCLLQPLTWASERRAISRHITSHRWLKVHTSQHVDSPVVRGGSDASDPVTLLDLPNYAHAGRDCSIWGNNTHQVNISNTMNIVNV